MTPTEPGRARASGRGQARLSPALVGALVLMLYVAACLLPAVDDGRSGVARGLHALLVGWRPPFTVPWSANLLLGGGLLCLSSGRYATASVLGAVAAMVGLATPAFSHPVQLLGGYYVWQASLILLALGARVLATETARLGTTPAPPNRAAA